MSEKLTRFFASRLGIILARNATQAGDFPIEVLVETVTSRENVRRAAEKLGCMVQVEEVEDEFKLTLTE